MSINNAGDYRKIISVDESVAQWTIFTYDFAFLSTLYTQKEQAESEYQQKCCVRDIAVIELLFATGMRISELCSLKPSDSSVNR